MCATSNSFSAPIDGTAQSNDTSCADGAGIQNIAHGTGTVAWTGLSSGIQYFYIIAPYTKSGTDIDYKIDGILPTANATTNSGYSISIEKTTDGAENNLGSPTDAVFTVTVTPQNDSGSAITGNIAYSGTATNGTDYATGATSFSIANGSSTATITLDITEDTLVEGTETIIATISSPSEGSLGTASVSANITDDESYSLAIAKTTDGAEDTTNTVFTVTVTPQNNSTSAITGNIAYSGTAINGTDYATGATTFNIPNGSSTATITLITTTDTLVEGTETAIATISGASKGAITTSVATANITDNDTAPTPPTTGGSSYTPTEESEEKKEEAEEKKEEEKVLIQPIAKPIVLERTTGNAEQTGTKPQLDNVTRLYIATFGRAPRSSGSNYWLYKSKLNLEDIARSFFDQEETKDKYPEGFSNYDFIVAIYNHVYARDPDQAGGDYWLEELESGKIEKGLFILAIINGAIGDDALMLGKQTIAGVGFVRSGVESLDMAKKVIDDMKL